MISNESLSLEKWIEFTGGECFFLKIVFPIHIVDKLSILYKVSL